MKSSWVSLLGEFDIESEKVTFKGKAITYPASDGSSQPGLAVGNLLFSQIFSEGTVTTDIEFKNVQISSACEVIFYYDTETKDFYSAGITSGPFMFGIRSFIGQKWNPYAFTGTHENLKSGKTYHMTVTFRGSQIRLSIDGVEVLSYTLPFTLKQSQTGLFFFNDSNIIVKNYRVESEKPKVFVVMQFTQKYNELYNEVIKELCTKEFNLQVVRADEIQGPGLIIADIVRYIKEAKIIIADISPANPNVFYEVGYAHALNKPTVLVAEKQTELPFDISPFRTLFYENTIAGKTKIQDGLRKQLNSILNP